LYVITMTMFKTLITAALLALSLDTLAQSADSENSAQPTEAEQEYINWAQGIWNALNPQTGEISLSSSGATLSVPESFYYLNPKDADTVLVEVWGNPPGQETLGMLFPAELTPFDEASWAVTIQYEEDGYVQDDDADKIDYQSLLSDMQKDTATASNERVAAGYEPIELIGWAADPYYDATTHKLYWAKELKFGEDEINTLNYNIRVLGRKGVLVLNFIAAMDQNEIIESNLETVLGMADFDTGAAYDDFDPEIDKVAAYGIGALVAGKVIAKTSLIALGLAFLKKFGIFILLGVGALIKVLISRKKSATDA